MNNFAATLGGPVVRNRTFFFAGYEGMSIRQPFAWSAAVPSVEFRRSSPPWVRPALNAFPMPNGIELGRGLAQWTGRNNRPSSLNVGSVRVDQLIASRLTAFARYHQSPSQSEFGNAQINRLELKSRSVSFGLNWRPGVTSVIDTRFNFSDASASSSWRQADSTASSCALQTVTLKLISSPNVCDYLVRFTIAGVGQLVSGREGERRQGQFQYVQSATFDRGSHSIRFGADFRRLTPSRVDAMPTVNIIADNLDDLAGVRNISSARSGAQDVSAITNELSLYVQDTWRVSSRLTASFGLRWEFSLPPSTTQDTYILDPPFTVAELRHQDIWPRRFDYFAPRLGFAYRPWDSKRTVIRAGAGIYYDSSLSLATDLLNGGPLNVTQYDNPRLGLFKLAMTFGFLSNLRLPRVTQWNSSVEHAFTDTDVMTLSYIGSSGSDLIRREAGGRGTTDQLWLFLATNQGHSSYHALQAQYQRRLAHNLQGRWSYTWSHSIDNGSADSALQWVGVGAVGDANRGSSDFDARHTLNASVTYEFGRSHWAIDGLFRGRTGFPITVLTAEQYQGISFANVFRPNLIGGVPVWLNDPTIPAGRRINPSAFEPAGVATQGNLGRNSLTGFGLSQLDLSVRREFLIGEHRSVQFRVEAFNALNRPYFADPQKYLISPLFGQPTSMMNLMLGNGTPASGLAPIFQAGGARSLQLALRFRF